MSDKQQVIPEEEVFKAIGRLDEATEVMKEKIENSLEDEDKIVGFFTILGRIFRGIYER